MQILKVGNLNKPNPPNLGMLPIFHMDGTRYGFTLFELIVVLAILGSVLFMTIPRFSAMLPSREKAASLNLLFHTISQLKTIAVNDKNNYTMHIDTADSSMWVTHQQMNQEEIDKAKENSIKLDDSLHIDRVEFFGITTPVEDEYRFNFSHDGYCDMALIHITRRDSANDITILIEPFLPYPEIRKSSFSFDLCN
ncbi:hypothetical protein MTBBW1_970020 [Desulfamplus magnetovallimortis]|uniref:Uncharacterized protein n=1 Tax=Desulfamplus magnetovallimortis TaxID=1246637 RepID=A0A1W1HL96_9BACT|nr:prepilin-type N-terminal cleavage/methylation domain-containing protein [Desulfamplus magnetovallimortis]SLM33240.1 hypothetical protein MTBBW1_970020 [Desulfamplus magnetovallimortis]